MDVASWLYQHYIKPYLDACPKGNYEFYTSLIEGILTHEEQQDYAKALEFWSTRAFFLGLRTGVGISGELP